MMSFLRNYVELYSPDNHSKNIIFQIYSKGTFVLIAVFVPGFAEKFHSMFRVGTNIQEGINNLIV